MKARNIIFRILIMIMGLVLAGVIVVLQTIDASAYNGDSAAESAMESSKYVTVTEKRDYIVFEPAGSFYSTGIIFYPGGGVEAESYAPLMHALAEEGYLCVIVKMPLHYAFLGVEKADDVRKDYRNVADWYMAGHSLGGAMASYYAKENSNQLQGVILLASYSTEDLKAENLDVLSIYGTMDGILNFENYETYRENLPGDCTEIVLEGGNHANFGNYGVQVGDNAAELAKEEQQAMTLEAILQFL